MHPLHDDRLHDYLDGRLPPAERAAFERALAADPSLAAALAELAAVSQSLRELPRLAAPPAMRAAIRTELAARPVPTLWPRWLDRQLLAAGLVGAMLLGGALAISRDSDLPAERTVVMGQAPRSEGKDDVGPALRQESKDPAVAMLHERLAHGSAMLELDEGAAKKSPADTTEELALLKSGDQAKSNGEKNEESRRALGAGGPADGYEGSGEAERLRTLDRSRQSGDQQAAQGAGGGNAEKEAKDAKEPNAGLRHRDGAQGGMGPAGAAGGAAPPAPAPPAESAGGRGTGDPAKPGAGSPRFGGRVGAPGEPVLDHDKAKHDDRPRQDRLTDGAPPTDAAGSKGDAGDKSLGVGSGSGAAESKLAAGGEPGGRMGRRAAGTAGAEGSAAEPTQDAHEQEEHDRSRAASARPLEIETTQPERLVVLLEQYAQRNGLAIRRVNTPDGAVVELADLSSEQLAALRPVMRRLETGRPAEADGPGNARGEEGERQQWAGSDDAGQRRGHAKRQPGAPAAERHDADAPPPADDESEKTESPRKASEGESRAAAKSPDRPGVSAPREAGPPQADPSPDANNRPPGAPAPSDPGAGKPASPSAPPAAKAPGSDGSTPGKSVQVPVPQPAPATPPAARPEAGQPPAPRADEDAPGARGLAEGQAGRRDPAAADDRLKGGLDPAAPGGALAEVEKAFQKLGKILVDRERNLAAAAAPRYSLRIVIRLAK